MEVEAFDSDGCEICARWCLRTSNPVREEIVHLYTQGFQTSEISRDLKITGRTV